MNRFKIKKLEVLPHQADGKSKQLDSLLILYLRDLIYSSTTGAITVANPVNAPTSHVMYA